MAAGRVCAIHQPNLFPRLSTLAKLLAADVWVVLDDVQFTRRDFQHRCRLSALDDPTAQQWLSLAVHRPHGRPTLIRDVRLVDPARDRIRTGRLVKQYYRRTLHWPEFRPALAGIPPRSRRSSQRVRAHGPRAAGDRARPRRPVRSR